MKKVKILSESKEGRKLVDLNSKLPHPHKPLVSLQLCLFGNTDETDTGDDIELLNRADNQILSIVKTYQDLMSLDRVNEEQADILAKILNLSEANPIVSHMLSIVDKNLPISEDEVSGEFSQHLKQKIGDDAYQAWREVRFM
jgi:hypothetical protein